jgi:hypothetical protein
MQVATQVQLRPWQVGKLTAAWQLYESALQHITEKRVVLLERLRAALQQAAAAIRSDSSAAAAVAAAAGASTKAAAIAQEDADGDINFFAVDSDEEDADAGGACLQQRLRLHSRITGAQLDVLLSTDEYHALCEGINANLAREDSIMILFDYAIGNMLDELQLAVICVASWPFMPLLGSISRWLVEPHLAADGAA